MQTAATPFRPTPAQPDAVGRAVKSQAGLATRAGRVAAAAAFTLAASTAALAVPVSLIFDGEGNVVIFDSAAGTGGWVGSISEFPGPGAVVPPRQFVTIVTFGYDASTNALNGQFEITDAFDLNNSFYGTVSGGFSNPGDLIEPGGQLSLDYLVTGGTGTLLRANGFGLSFLTYDSNSFAFNNYSESGLFAFDVPAPAPWLLAGTALGLLGLSRRRQVGS